MSLSCPVAQINQTAAVAAKRFEFFFFDPGDFFFTGWAFNFHKQEVGMFLENTTG